MFILDCKINGDEEVKTFLKATQLLKLIAELSVSETTVLEIKAINEYNDGHLTPMQLSVGSYGFGIHYIEESMKEAERAESCWR